MDSKVMQVSVIIPVYNAADYVQQAVESALAQPETTEVILVEDGSPDNSLAVCQRLAAEHRLVHLYRHPDGKNHGAGATRNLAIQKSKCDYIAFLDADDFFLPSRFTIAKRLLETDSTIDGVYEAVETHFENEAARQRWDELGWGEITLATMTERVPPGELFRAIVAGRRGGFHLDGLVVKRTVFDRTSLFDEHLRLHQDTALMWKMAAVAKLEPGRLKEPVAMRRVHDHNRWSATRPPADVFRSKFLTWYTLWCWSKENLEQERQQLVLHRLLRHTMDAQRFNRPYPGWARGLGKRLQLTFLLFEYPEFIWETFLWQRFVPSPRHWGQQFYNRLVQRFQA